jgi:hypothetical protein
MHYTEFLDNDKVEFLDTPFISFNFEENNKSGQKPHASANSDWNFINFIKPINYINENEYNIQTSFNNDARVFSIETSNTNILNLSSTISNSQLKEIKDTDLRNIRFINEKQDKKELIFKVNRDNKNIGRIKKNSNLIGKHDKFSEDNIIRKFKGRFHEKCRIYINNEYKRYLLNHKHDIKKVNDLLQRISPKISRKIKKEDNLKWLEMNLKQVFSENVSEKCSLYPADYNKNNISKLYEENEAKEVIDILNKPVKEMLGYFINNNEIPGFDTLDKDTIELENKMKNDSEEKINNYIDKYRRTSKNFESIFINKSSRNNKDSKNNDI